ncbi:MAG: hypothetical protein AVDCRST_MAG87-392, partial [uncultured Thermomicrobiales bacterium]
PMSRLSQGRRRRQSGRCSPIFALP